MKNFVLGTIGFAIMVGMMSQSGTFSSSDHAAVDANAAPPAEKLDAWELAAKKQREERASNRSAARRSQAAAMRSTSSSASADKTVLQRQSDGHFYSDVQIQGQSVEFLVDTGASMVALSEADARKAGVNFNRSKYRVIGEGASGPVRGQYVLMSSLSFAGRTKQNVRAVVLEGGQTSLLGQSVLSDYAIDMTGGQMTIR